MPSSSIILCTFYVIDQLFAIFPAWQSWRCYSVVWYNFTLEYLGVVWHSTRLYNHIDFVGIPCRQSPNRTRGGKAAAPRRRANEKATEDSNNYTLYPVSMVSSCAGAYGGCHEGHDNPGVGRRAPRCLGTVV